MWRAKPAFRHSPAPESQSVVTRKSHNLFAAGLAIAGLWVVASVVACAQQSTPPLAEKDWQKALDTIREVALDKNDEARLARTLANYGLTNESRGRQSARGLERVS